MCSSDLGLLTARWLSQKNVREIFLASRRGALHVPRAVEWESLQASHAAICIERCDVAEASDLRHLGSATGPLVGVWHASGVLADALLPKQSAVTLTQVCAPKMNGGWALHLAFSSTPVQSFLLFSSVASLLGGAGQANYSAANAGLDALAGRRQSGGWTAVSVQWGPWAEVGMAAHGAANERMAAMEEVTGFRRIVVSEGLSALHMAMLPHAPWLMGVLAVKWHRLLDDGTTVPAFLSNFAERTHAVKLSSSMASQANRSKPCSISIDSVLALVAQVAGVKTDEDVPLTCRLMMMRLSEPRLGVWHAAGVLADSLLQNQTAKGVAFVYAPKARGAWQLQAAGTVVPLNACVLFSFITGLFGFSGQTNYCAANASLDALSGCRRTMGQVAVSMQWGAWAEIGMGARGAAGDRFAAMEAASGMGRIGLAQGLGALRMSVMRSGDECMGVATFTWNRYLGDGKPVPAFLSAFAPKAASAPTSRSSGKKAAASGGVTLDAVLEMAKRTAGGAVDADAPLIDAGIDSLGAVELRNQLKAAAGQEVMMPSTLIFDYPTFDYPTARQLATLLAPVAAEEEIGRAHV